MLPVLIFFIIKTPLARAARCKSKALVFIHKSLL
jgi:hypothetical protein